MSNGGVHIPPDVRKFLEFTLGLSWPESDDQGLVALWKAWEAFEDAAEVYEAATRAAGVAIPQVLEGDTGEFFAHFLNTTIPDGVAGLGEAAGELAKMAQNAAADVYKTKVMFVVFAAFTLASIIHLMATLIGALFTGVVIAAARVALTAIWRALITRMGQLSLSGGLSQATKTALLKFAKDLAIKTGGFAAFGAALMGGTDFGVQARQIADGDRQGWDTKSLTSSLVGGALGGAFAGIFHSAAGAIRKTAFDLRDRLTIDPDHLDTLVKQTAGVTAQDIITTITKPLAALGDAGYATGQMITVIATAPLVNLALGAPTGNPALGALGALSKYGGGRTAAGTGTALDTIHPPEIPDLTIPQVEKPNDAEKPSSTEKAETTEKPVTDHTKNTLDTPQTHAAPPPYTPAAGQPELRQDKSPAYTTSPHALGTLHITAAANGAAPTTLSPLSDAASQTALAAGATPERGNRGTATPDTLAPEVGHGSPDGITSVVAGAPPGHRLLTPDTAVVSETRPDTSNQARSTGPDTTSSRVQADRTAAPLSTTASLSPATPAARPDTTGGHLAATARAADTVLPDSTRSFLAETAPATTRPTAMPDTLHTPAFTDFAPPPSLAEPSAITTARPHDVPASFPVEPVRAIPLPGNGGVAFVPDGYTTNITNAFPHPEPGVFRVIVQHRDNTFALPGHHTLDPAHRPERLIAALQDLPAQLAAWSNYTKIDLLACDLTPTLLDRLTPAIHATFGIELHAPYRQTPLFVAPTGGLSLTDPGIPHTLHLAPKRRRSDTTVADPKAPETSARLAEVSARLLHQYGNISARWLSYSIPRETFPQKLFDKQFHLHLRQEREKQANSGTLWSPLYRGMSNFEHFSKDKLNDFTAWIYRKAVADQTSNPAAIAKTAAEAGFAVGETKLANAVNAATEAAAIDGRRHPSLTLGKPEHRDKIIALLDRILANTDRRTQAQTLASLNDVNVHGSSNLLRALITEREQALKDDPALAEAARRLGLPALRPTGAFLGRFLDVAKAADRGWIDKLAYAAAWEHKSATADELTRLLLDEGINGDPGVLREIVTTVIGEATRQGDRLPLLDATDQGQHAAIHARTAAIVNVTPALYTSTGPVLVKHMRTRHITGPQHDLETIARTILETPAEKLTQDYSLAPLDLDDLPSAARAIGAETEPTGYGPDTSPAIEALATTAKQLLLDFGDLNISYLVTKWPNPNRQSKLSFKEMSEHLTTERTNLKTSGELWLPTYRGLRNSGKDSHTDDLTAWLYRQVIADHTNSPTAIAYDAAAAGFTTGYNQLLQETRAAMKAATNDGRRHGYLTITKPEHRDRIIALIDRILANAPSPTRNKVIDLLHEVNGHGDDKVLQVLVSERRQALQDDPALAEAARQLGLPTLQPTGAFRGRFLDTANEADHSWIDSLAYAAAWEHKTATVEHLVTLLTQEGIRDTNGTLTPLIARILAEADAHGDRHTTLSAHRPADHNAILRRTGTLVLKNHHALFPLDPAQATTRLVRHMRRNHITGTQDALRDIAHTVYTLPTHQPLPGTHTIPLPTHNGLTVTAIPLPGNGGIAFIPATYATNVLNAFPHPEPGIFRLITQHRHGLFALPAHPHPIPHRPDQLIHTLHRLPPALANWGDHTTITLLACDLTPTHRDDLTDLIHTNLGLQLTIPHTETPLYITPDGTITTTDPGLDNTLHLAPPDTPTQTTLTITGAWRRPPGTNETFKQFLLDNNHATETDLTPNKTGKLPPRGQALVKNWAITIGDQRLSSSDTAEHSGGLVTHSTVARWRQLALLEAGEGVLPDADTLATTGAWRRAPGTTETFKQFLLDNNHATKKDLTPNKRGDLLPWGLALVKNWVIATGAERLSTADTAEHSGGLVTRSTARQWRQKALLEAGGAALPDADTLTITGAWRRTPGTTETFKQFLLDNNHATTTDVTPDKRGNLSPWGLALVKNWVIAAVDVSGADAIKHSGGLVTKTTVSKWRQLAFLEAGGAVLPDAGTLTITGAWRRTPGTTETLKQFLLHNNHTTTTDLTPNARGELPPRGQALIKNWAIATATGDQKLQNTEAAEHSGGLVTHSTIARWRRHALSEAVGTELPDSDTLATTGAWRRTPGTTETLKQFLLHNNHTTTTDLTPDARGELPPRGQALVKNWAIATATGDQKLSSTETANHSGGLVSSASVLRWRQKALLEAGGTELPDSDTLTTTGAWRRTPGTTETLKQFLLHNNHTTTTDLTPDARGELPPRGLALVRNWVITVGGERLSSTETAEHSGGLVSSASVLRWRQKALLEAGGTELPDSDTLTTTGAWRRTPGTTETFKQFLLHNNHTTTTDLTPNKNGELPPWGLALVKNWVIVTATGDRRLKAAEAAEHSGGLVTYSAVSRWRAGARAHAGPAATTAQGDVSQLELRPTKRRKTESSASRPEFVVPADIREFVVGFDPETNRTQPSLWAMLEHFQATFLPELDLSRDSRGLPTSTTTRNLVRDWATARAKSYPADWIAKMSGWSITTTQAEGLSARMVTQPSPHSAVPAGPSPSPSIATFSPLGPVRVIPLPEGGGAAFVSDAFATNVLNAFPHPEPGVFTLVVHHQNGYFPLPGEGARPVPHQAAQLVETLKHLPSRLVGWHNYREIELFACNLADGHADQLAAIARSALDIELTSARPGRFISITRAGDIVATIDQPTGLPPGTLTLGGGKRGQPTDSETGAKRPRIDEDPNHGFSPEQAELLRSTFTELYLRHGDLGAQSILSYARDHGHTFRQKGDAEKLAVATRHRLEKDDLLWQPVYQGRRISEKFDPDNVNSLTVFMYWQASTQPEFDAAKIVRSARETGLLARHARQLKDAQEAIKAAEKDGRRSRSTQGDAPARRFLDRPLNADEPKDRGLIEKFAYTASWAEKTADQGQLTDRLRELGVTGSADNLTALVVGAMTEAQKNGDRLELLQTVLPAHRDAIRNRVAGILLTTPSLRSAGSVNAVVKHMRMRHITGDQEELSPYASQALETSDLDLFGDPTIEIDWNLRPILGTSELDPQNPLHVPIVDALARNVVDEFGTIDLKLLTNILVRRGVKNGKGTTPAVTKAKSAAESEGTLWGPIYRGVRTREKFNAEAPNDLTVLLLRLAADNTRWDAGRIAGSADEAGFTGYKELLSGAAEAIRMAERNGRRNPLLSFSSKEQHGRINALIDAALAEHPDMDLNSMIDFLWKYNVQADSASLRNAVANRKKELDSLRAQDGGRHSGDILSTARLPTLDPVPLFAGRSVDLDRDLVMRVAYAAAWADKAATPDQIADGLRFEGISGSRESLIALATAAISEATRNGDRLPELSVTDPGNREAVRARIGGILRNTPALHAHDRLNELVTHMRMRHITGPQEALKAQALVLLRIPLESLLADPTTQPDAPFGPISLHADKGAASSGHSAPREETTRFDDVDEVTAGLWLLSIDHPREMAAQIARRAEEAGLTGHPDLVERAGSVIDIAVRHQRRHPFLDVDVSSDRLALQTVIGALFITEPGATIDSVMALLPSYNITGNMSKLRALLAARKSDLARTAKRTPEIYQEIVRSSRTTLRPEPERPFAGRSPDTDRPLIEKLAYAAFMVNKEATTEDVVARLVEEGIVGDPVVLTEVVVQAAAEAARRHAPAPALPVVSNALHQRIGEILLSDPELRDPENPDGMTGLVKALRERDITTPEDVLRDHTQTVLAIRSDVPLPGGFSIPVPSPAGRPVRAMPFPGGVAFVRDVFAQNIFNAFPQPEAGTLRVVVPREHRRGGAFVLPGFLPDTDLRHDPAQFAEVLANLPASIAAGGSIGTIALFSCRVTPESGTNLTRLIRQRTGWQHLDLTVAHPNKPVAFTPTGGIRLTDNGKHPVGTLILGPKPATVAAVRGEIDGSVYHRYVDSGGVVRAVAFRHKEQAETLAEAMAGRDLAAQLGHPGSRVIFTHHVRDRYLIPRGEDRSRRADVSVLFRIFDALVQDGVLPWRQENILLASCETSQAEADRFRELARDNGYTGDLRVITDQIVEIDPDAGASLLPPKARGASSGNDQTPQGGDASGRAIRFGFAEENEAESSTVSRDTAVPALPAPAAPMAEVASLKPEADGALLDRATLPTMSRLAGLPLETLAGVLERFRVDNAPGLAPASHLNAWVEAQFSSRSTGNRSLPLSQVAGRTGGLVTGREIAEILARKVVDAHGSLTPAAVRLQLTTEGIRHPELNTAITEALARAEAEGSAWHPTYRGDRRPGVFDPGEPGPATLLLWRLAVDHPRDTAAGLAHRAEQAGLLGGEDLVRNAELAVDSAVHDQRRVLSAARPSDHPRIHSLIDALLVTEPGLDTPAVVDRLRGYSVHEGLRGLHPMVESRLGLPAMDIEAARALLVPRPAGAILGGILDAADAGNREIIGHLAYATAWTHKTDTVEQLAARLRRDGVTGPEPALLRVITETVAEADLHGDRLESLPADHPAYHHLLRLRVEQILADTPSLRDSRNPERLTQLVRQMRLHKVTGPQYLLTAHAHSALTRPATTPLGSGATTVGAGFPGPIRTLRTTPGTRYQHIVDADGTITGVGFLPESEAPILRAAAARHDLATQLGHPGARLVFAHHDHTGYTIPHPTDGAGLFDALAGLGAAWKHHDILLVTCLPSPTHTEQFRAAARTHGYQGTIHTTTSPHTEITEHHGARPLHPGDTPHPDAIILNPQSQTVTFAKGARDLMAGDWFNADHPAQRVIQLGESLYDGLLNAYESRGELPEIEVHGYGNSRRPGRAMATSVARADSVVVALLFGLNAAHQNRPAADRIPDFDLVPQAMLKITHGRAGSPLSSGRDLEERRRGVFVRIPALPLPAGRVPTFTYRNPSGVDVSWLEPLRFGSQDDPIRVPRDFLVPPGPALALESPSGAMLFPRYLFGVAWDWSWIRKYPGVISLRLDVDHRTGEVLLRDGIRLSYRDFATWVHEMLNGAPDSQRLLLLADHGGEQPGRAGNQPGVPASSLAGVLSAATHGRVLTPLTGTIWTYGGEEHYATNWGLFQDGTLLGVYERHETWRRAGTSVADAVAATRLEYPRHPETAQDVNGSVAEREATAAAAAEAYINPPPPLPSASKPVKLPEQTRIKFSPDSHRIELRYRNELERLFRQVYLHAQEAYDEAEAFPQVIITGLEENTSRSKQLREARAQTVKDLAVQWMAKELEERTARRETTFDAGSLEESRSFLESFIRLGSRTYDGDPTHEVVIELFNLRETPEELAGASSADHAPAPNTLYQHIIDVDGTITGVGFLPENEAPTLHNAAARHDLATQLGHPGARLVFAHHDHTGYTVPHPTGPATFFHTLDTTLTHLGTTWKNHDILLVTCLPNPTHTEQIRTTAQELGYRGTIHTTTSPHTEITEHHGARPLNPGDTPHPDAIILNPTSQTIKFPQGARSVVDRGVVDRLHALGTALYSPLVNAQRAGGPLPRIEITGYGNSRNTAQATTTGQERADSVRLRILNGMREEHASRESGTASTDPAQLTRAIVTTSGGRAPSPKSVGRTLTERRRSAFVEVPAFPQAPARVPTFTYRAPHGVDSSRLGPLRFSPPLGSGRMTELGFLVPEGPALAMEAPGGAMIFPPWTDVLGTGWETLRPFHGVLAIWAQPNLHGEVRLRDGNRVSYRDFATWVRDMAPGSHRVLLLADRAGAQPGQRPSQPVRPDLSLAAILSETMGGSVLAPIDQLLPDSRTYFSLRWGLFRNGELVGVHARAPVDWRHELGHTDAVRDSGLAAPPAPWQPLTAAENAARAAMAEERSAMAAEAATAYLASPMVATPAAPAQPVFDAHVAPPGAAYARPPVPSAEPIVLPWKVEVSFPTGSNVLRDGNQHLENLFRHIYVRSLQVAANAGFDYPHVFITGLFDSPDTGTSHASARAKARAEALKARAVEWFNREEAARRSRRQERFGPDTEVSTVAEHLLRVGESRARTGGQSHDVVIEIMYTATDDEDPAP